MWAKQEKVEQLIDPEDVAAGNQVRMRWRDEDQWIRPAAKTHPMIVSDDVFALVRARLASNMRGKAKPRSTTRPYLLRGLLFCAHCGHRMQGAWRKNRAVGSGGRTLYRCEIRNMRALPPELADHPKTLYLREDAVVGPLDSWIASLVTPEALAEAHSHALPGAGAKSSARSARSSPSWTARSPA